MKIEKPTLPRRHFLLAAGATAAAGVAATAGRKEAGDAAPAASRAAPPAGYQVTEHVRNYYRTARI